MNSALEHSIYRKFHPRLPHFTYRVLATDELTQLYATWQFACDCMYRIMLRTPNHRTIELCERVSELHKRRFLRAFAKEHTPTEQQKEWAFGCAKFYTTKIQPNANINYARAFRDRYAECRYWRQHQPNLP